MEIKNIFLSRIHSKEKWRETKLKQVEETRTMIKSFYESLTESHQKTLKSVKCSASELKDIFSMRSKPSISLNISPKMNETMRNTSIYVKQYKSKHFPGVLIRGVRSDNPNNVISDYPLMKNCACLNTINQETLKTLLTAEDLGEGQESIAQKIAVNFRNSSTTRNLEVQKRKLQILFNTKNDFFEKTNITTNFRNKNKSYIERFKSKIEEGIKKSYEEDDPCIIRLEGGIEKGLLLRKLSNDEGKIVIKGDRVEEDLMSKMENIMKKYHKKAESFM